ncbi:DUF2884 family protein [Rhodanobacter sp. DHB23]|uniref:DUF2884 family protein n=1 Tax=Rhodanobacter sp. DHB23 TaxID=2775923 RepID=UPI00177AE8DE|nr:DUF2884 family protein [Rhodanobacter sp. DHB23]MBD8873911.1 hypothetical protein [Rhodanobacter sp. DHB23]
MKAPVRPLLLATLACVLAACSTPDTVMENGAIALYGNTVTLRVPGSPNAVIGADGTLTVDGKPVPATPAQRVLLAQYNQSVQDVRRTGLAMGKAGIGMAAKAITAAASSSSGNAGKAADAGADQMKTLSLDICRDTAAIKAAQDQLAMQLAAFKPYAAIVGATSVTDCMNDAKS